MFDVMTNDGPPRSLYTIGDTQEPDQLVDYLDPVIKGRFDRLCDAATANLVDDDFHELRSSSIEVAFQIGILAGAIFTDCPRETIDCFERGLVVATLARSWEVKKG